MTLKKVLYPLDLTGANQTNRINGELVTIGTDRYRCFAVNYGYFYEDSVVLVDRATNKPLTEGKDADYVCLYYNADISSITQGKQRVCGAILVINPDVSTTLSVGYQLVGGHFANYTAQIQEAIDLLELDNRNVYWKAILDKPDLFEPAPHAHDIGDAYGFEYITDLLGALNNSILVGDVAAQQLVLDAINKFYADLMAALNRHLQDSNNPHKTSAHQTGAYTQEEIDRFLANFTKKFNDLDPVFAGINDSIQMIQDSADATAAGLSNVMRTVKTNSDDITRIFTQIGNIQSSNSGLSDRMDQAESDITGIKQAIVVINQTDANQNQALTDYNNRIAALETWKPVSDNWNTRQDTRLTSLESSVTGLSNLTSDMVHWSDVSTSSSGYASLIGKIPYIRADGVMEIGKYVDYHVPGDTSDYTLRTTINYNSSVGGYEMYFSGYINSQDSYIRSDIRDKTDIERMVPEDAARILTALSSGIRYRLHGKGHTTAGLSAQEVQEVFPEAVAIMHNEDGEEERLTLRSGALQALLVTGWNYQQAVIDQLVEDQEELRRVIMELRDEGGK